MDLLRRRPDRTALAALIAVIACSSVHAQSRELGPPTIWRAWAGAGYEFSPQMGPHGPIRQAFVTEAAAGLPFIPLEFGLRIGWAVLDEGTRTTDGVLLGLRLGFDATELLPSLVDGSRSVSLVNPTFGIGGDFTYATGTRGEVGRAFLYAANTFYLTCNVGIHVSADVSLTDWSHVPPTFFIGIVGGQRWVFDDSFVNCNEWARYTARQDTP